MAHKRKRWAGALLLVALCFGLIDWLVWREVHQQQMNAALIAAVKRNDTRAALTLIHAHSNPNCREQGEAPPSIWQFLLMRWRQMRGEKPTPIQWGPSALRLAVEKNNAAIVKALVAAGARDVNVMPLAVEFNDAAVLKIFLEAGWNPNLKDERGWPLLVKALFWPGGLEANAALLLIHHGADVNYRDEGGDTPLYFAAHGTSDPRWKDQSPAVMKALLDKGAQVNVQTNYSGWTPLMIASSLGRPVLVHLLLERGAKVDMRAQHGETAFSMTSRYCKYYRSSSEYKREEYDRFVAVLRLLKAAGARE